MLGLHSRRLFDFQISKYNIIVITSGHRWSIRSNSQQSNGL